MTALAPITNGERVAWQRRAAATLVAILDANKDLPAISAVRGAVRVAITATLAADDDEGRR